MALIIALSIPFYLLDGTYTQVAVEGVKALYKSAQATNEWQPYISYLEGLSVWQNPHQEALKEYIETL